jgi:CP family cyanate transporter-like MFS transporter
MNPAIMPRVPDLQTPPDQREAQVVAPEEGDLRVACRGALKGRLLVVAAIVLVALNLRTAVTSVAPVLGDLRDDLGLSTTGAGILGMLPPFAFAVFGAVTPVVIRRLGLERTAVLTMVLTFLGQGLRAVAPESISFLLLSLLALGGMGMGNVVLPPLVKRYFPDRIGSVTAAYVLVMQLGTAVPPLLAVPVANAAGWRVSIGQWAALAVVAAVPWVLLAARARRDAPVAGTGTAHPHVPVRALLTSRVAWGLAALMGITSLNTYALFAWLPEIFVDAGLSPAAGGSLLSLFAAVGLPMAVLIPWSASRMRNPFPIVVVCLVAYVVSYLGLALAPAAAPVLWTVFAGIAPASFPLSLALVNLRSRSHEGSAALSGFAQGVGYLVAGLGPLVVAALRETTGGWKVPMFFLLATLVPQVVGGFIISRPRMVEDDVRPVLRRPADTATNTLDR